MFFPLRFLRLYILTWEGKGCLKSFELFKKKFHMRKNSSSHLSYHGSVEDSAARPANVREIPSLT